MTLHGILVGAAGLLALALAGLTTSRADAQELGKDAHLHLEFGPAFTAFIGGSAEETGAGFAGSLSYLVDVDEGAVIGLRINYSQAYFTEILNVPGQEMRSRVISGGFEAEFRPEDTPVGIFGYMTFGAINLKADTFNLVLTPTRYTQNDFIWDLGGGARFFPMEHLSLGLEANIAHAYGTTADFAEWHFRLAAMIGARY